MFTQQELTDYAYPNNKNSKNNNFIMMSQLSDVIQEDFEGEKTEEEPEDE